MIGIAIMRDEARPHLVLTHKDTKVFQVPFVEDPEVELDPGTTKDTEMENKAQLAPPQEVSLSLIVFLNDRFPLGCGALTVYLTRMVLIFQGRRPQTNKSLAIRGVRDQTTQKMMMTAQVTLHLPGKWQR